MPWKPSDPASPLGKKSNLKNAHWGICFQGAALYQQPVFLIGENEVILEILHRQK
jgi:hypothetical protein